MRVGFVGAGRMGGRMVSRLVGAGHDVRALARNSEKCSAVADLGATAVRDLAEAGQGADVVIVCVFTDEQVRQVCLQDGLLAAMPRGTTLVIHTTGSPSTVEMVAAHPESGGVEVVDAPVSGGPHDIAAGQVTLFVGGSDAAVARVRPLLSSYSDPVCHVGPLGAGQRVKLVNNTLFAAQIGLLRGAVELGERLGVAEAALLRALPHGSATSKVLNIVAARGSVGAFVDTVGEFVSKDVAVVRGVAAELGSDLGVLDDVIRTGLRG